MKIFIAIPTYNNSKSLSILLPKIENEIARIANKYTFLIVIYDDGSLEKLNHLKKKNVKIVRSKNNRGLGKTIVAIFRDFLRSGCDYLITIDGDGQHSPLYIPKMLLSIHKGYDWIIACRHFSKEITPFDRYLLSVSTSALINKITGYFISDPLSGFKCYKRSTVEIIFKDYKSLNITGYCSCLAEIVLFWKHFGQNLKFKILKHPAIYKDGLYGVLTKKYKLHYSDRVSRFHEVVNVFMKLHKKDFI